MSIRSGDVEVRSTYVASCGGWEYETVFAVAVGAVRLGHLSESLDHVWATPDQVGDLPLHSGVPRRLGGPDGELRQFVEVTRA